MFKGFSEQTLAFMWSLRFNNEKSWFEAHRSDFQQQLAVPMRCLAETVYDGFSQAADDLGLNLHISRIYRDARRLHGNGPYKDHLWFTLRQEPQDWTDKPAFWFELLPESWSYGLGFYCARAETMAKLRARIDNKPREIKKLMTAFGRQSEFILEGDSYKKPKGDPGGVLSELYNKKTFSLIHEEENSQLLYSPDFAQRIIEGFNFLVPYYRYFSTLDSDSAPRKD